MSGAIPLRSLYAFVERTESIVRFVFIFKRPEFKRREGKDKAIPLQAWTGPEGSRRLRLPDFKTIGT
jgi:hypothetical protein